MGCLLPATDRLVTAALVKGSTGLTVRVVAALLVTRLGVVATWRSERNITAQVLRAKKCFRVSYQSRVSFFPSSTEEGIRGNTTQIHFY